MAAKPTLGELENSLHAVLEPFHEVRAAYLFGSHAQGRARVDSDLDVALSFDAHLRVDVRAELMLDLLAALSRALGPLGERADLLDLDRASSAVAFRAIRDGRSVLCRDLRERACLEAKIARRYDDERPYRELFRRAARDAGERMAGADRG